MVSATAAARYFASIGWNPLPSCSTRKGPAVKDYAKYRDGERIPAEWLVNWRWTNLQICLGVPWGLAVIDLDGCGICEWRRWGRRHDIAKTWTVRTGGGGMHLYWRLPPGLQPCPTRQLWGVPRGDKYQKHQFIELLADKAMVIAPPSRHVDTGRTYCFLPGRGPRELKRPAEIPHFLLSMPGLPSLTPPKRWYPAPHVPSRLRTRKNGLTQALIAREQVMAALSPQRILDIAAGWGLRFTGRMTAGKWAECHAIGREDQHASASVDVTTGVYSEPFQRSLSFFDIAVELGQVRDWREALLIVRSMVL